MGQYRYHVFVCTSGNTCPTQGSKDVHQFLKTGIAERGLKGIVRVNHSGCMSQCGHGPMVVVYPEDTWYSAVDLEKAARILDEHLVGGAAVDELRYIAPPGDNKLVDD